MTVGVAQKENPIRKWSSEPPKRKINKTMEPGVSKEENNKKMEPEVPKKEKH